VSHHLLIVGEDFPKAYFAELQRLSPDWKLACLKGRAEVLEYLKGHPCDVMVCDFGTANSVNMQWVNEVGQAFPNIIRFIIAELADKEALAKFITGSHQFLPKPCDAASMHREITRALKLEHWMGNASMKQLVGRIRSFPTIPSLYFEVLKELRSPDPSAQRVGDIVAKDMAMYTKMLQMLNSSFYSLPRQITDTTEAVNILGFEMVKSLVLCIQVFSQFEKVKPYYFSIDKLWRHSTSVAHAARKIARFEEMPPAIADEAYTAGLLHDIGKLVLVTNFADQYRKVQEHARNAQVGIWEAEKQSFGVSHAEIGAYLLGVWGMPLSLAETTAFHHFPKRDDGRVPGTLLAVHAADSLIHERSAEPDGLIIPCVHEDYLAHVNLTGRTGIWREVVADRPVEKPRSRPPEPPPPSASEPQSKPSESRWPSWLRLGHD
jgi:putative nucleotidyltransferase with HDIG domain